MRNSIYLCLYFLITLFACKKNTDKNEQVNHPKQEIEAPEFPITKKWWKESVVYQIYPRSFYDSNGDGIGDLKGITQKLDHLQDLGVDIIWLGPIFKSPNADNGYDVSDYRAIMSEFGTMEDFDEMLQAIKKRKMRIILDLVANHSSDEHPWFEASRKSKDNPFRDYYIWRPAKKTKLDNGKEEETFPNNYVSFFGGSAWELDKTTDEYYLHTFAKKQPDLNWENYKVRQEIYSIMKFWLDKGIDGWRMDVIPFISKDTTFADLPAGADFAKVYASGAKLHDYLKEMNKEVIRKYDMLTIGEGIGLTPETAPLLVDERREELNMIYHFDHMGIDRSKEDFMKRRPDGFSLIEFKAIFSRWDMALGNFAWNSILLGNHDFPRMVSRFGNTAKYRDASAKLLATLLMTLRGTPYIYQGDEIGMTNSIFPSIADFNDIQTKNAYQTLLKNGGDTKEFIKNQNETSRDHARTPIQWDDAEFAGFSKVKPWIGVNPNYKEINVKKAKEDKNSIFYFFKNMIAFRKQHQALIYGHYTDIDPKHNKIFAYTRQLAKEKFLIVLNFSTENISYTIPKSFKVSKWVIGNYPNNENNTNILTLKPYEARVYEVSDK